MKTTASPEARLSLLRALRLLEVFRSLDQDLPMGEAVSFLMIATGETLEGGLSVTELSQRGKFGLSSASRYVQSLGAVNRHRKPGHELVIDPVDPMERRRKILKVSPQGQHIITAIHAAIGE